MTALLRCVLCCCVAVLGMAVERTQPISREDLMGRWEASEQGLDEQTRAAAAAALKPGEARWHIAFMNQICRVYFGDEQFYAGMWRVDEATATSAVIVVQPRGKDERRLRIAFDGAAVTPEGLPWKLPFRKAKQ